MSFTDYEKIKCYYLFVILLILRTTYWRLFNTAILKCRVMRGEQVFCLYVLPGYLTL